MSVNIPQFFFDVSKEVRALSDSFLSKHKLNYFQYCSVYKDGSHSFLVNRPDFVETRYHANRGVCSSVDGDQIDAQSYVFLWNGNLPNRDTDMARELDIDNGICFVQRHPNHYNLIAFGAATRERGTLNFYLNHGVKLRGFIEEFTDQAKDLIRKADQNRFLLPHNLRDENEKILFWDRNKRVHFHGRSTDLSLREFECLRLTARGYTMVEIAERLELSNRTVESYLNRAKLKLGVDKKSELIRIFLTHFDS